MITVQRGLICRLCVHGRAYIGKAPKVILHNFEDCQDCVEHNYYTTRSGKNMLILPSENIQYRYLQNH